MLRALALAVAQLPDRALRAPLLASLAWTALFFALVWTLAFKALARLEAPGTVVGALGLAAGTVLLVVATWLLFVAVQNAILFCYADRIATAVERRYYPEAGPSRAIRWRDGVRSGLRLLGWTVIGNLLAIPVYLLVPGANLILFLTLNGYLLGRAYFDAVVLRHETDQDARRIWRDCRFDFTVNGAVSVALVAVPLVNLIAPIVGLAASVHLVERYRRPATPGGVPRRA